MKGSPDFRSWPAWAASAISNARSISLTSAFGRRERISLMIMSSAGVGANAGGRTFWNTALTPRGDGGGWPRLIGVCLGALTRDGAHSSL